ncbi:MAG: hydantoinase/oxoprolinase family protein [Alphaproteobacteria bacterium]|nr:hydantoinase/oxoprolinase family protein [Alphaproteobacteria bacterium]
MLWLGVDVGGTFTDLVLYDAATGELSLAKTPSTPSDQSIGILAGIDRLAIDLARVAKFAHGTTIATNTTLERKGAKLAVVTTRGFRDVLIVGRGNRTQLYDIKAVRPPPLVQRSSIFEVDERTLHDGTIMAPLDRAETARLANTLAAGGYDAVAICFLHAYANEANERAARDILAQALPGAFIATSAGVLGEAREYERFATTALNAYVAPRMASYLGALKERLQERGYTRPVSIMTSNGGTLPADQIIRRPVGSMLSGPAAGVIGAVHVARQAGHADIITYDMGGTSTDCCLVRGHAFAMTNEGAVGGLPNRVPQIEISTVGAGGGSIASLGNSGFLSVGPESAGAVPGPACYGRGGNQPTVTDANMVLGRLAPAAPLGGEIALDPALARAAVEAIARPLDLDAIQMADGIVRLAVTRMTGTIKEISIMRGIDPRDFTLFAYGGAGPLHAAFIAEELGIRRVLIPPFPGNFSAFGLLVADARGDYSRTRLIATRDLGPALIEEIVGGLRHEARQTLADAGFADDAMRFEASLDMRFQGQAFELAVPLTEGRAGPSEIEAQFRRVYEERYAHAPDDASEVVCFRLAAYGLDAKPALPRQSQTGSLAGARMGKRQVAFAAKFETTEIYDRERLPLGQPLRGPALIEEAGTTTVVPPGFTLRADDLGNLVLECL